MELRRRDALVALAGVAAGSAAIGYLPNVDADEGSNGLVSDVHAVAQVVYPSAVDVTEEFVQTYVVGRSRVDDEYSAGIRAAVRGLDDYARRHYNAQFRTLSVDTREAVLKELGVDKVKPFADGTVPERIRYFLVGDLLYVLFTTPKGGRLVGNENPTGFPGGTESYQRGPNG